MLALRRTSAEGSSYGCGFRLAGGGQLLRDLQLRGRLPLPALAALPYFRRETVRTLAGLKTGLFTSMASPDAFAALHDWYSNSVAKPQQPS